MTKAVSGVAKRPTTLQDMSTFQSASSGGSSSSSERYNLNEHDKRDILVYKYRSKEHGSNSSLEIQSQHALAKWLDSGQWNLLHTVAGSCSFSQDVLVNTDTVKMRASAASCAYPLRLPTLTDTAESTAVQPNLRVSRKKIPRGNSRLDVRMEDLFCEPERTAYAKYPSSKNSLANIGLPSRVYWKRLLFNEFPDLYIVSPVSSPENSLNNSPESSQHVTPANTFGKDGKRNPNGERAETED
jgi:hypothetical protein